MRAGLIAAVGFELFKQVGSIYLRTVLRSPAGATFGPVLGLMVFAYVTAYLVLFSTAWAATDSEEDPRAKHVDPPGPRSSGRAYRSTRAWLRVRRWSRWLPEPLGL
ncbi:virulence factor BrkB family protein [Mycobacterium kansasii]|uniref:Virulence factor BrkB family protein n=1 Tax=Mycobacterium kansasii TaxID=1768 RepID=A0A1V3WKS6_MYCKA|nr:virulence factor BrkB family protein [Mycobacterium kansasii]